MKKPELLCPAGNMAKLKTAFRYGADAVYIGGGAFGLRARADNFTREEMDMAMKYAHELGKKVYVTMNILPRNDDLAPMAEYAKELSKIGADGVIVSDPGGFLTVREAAPDLKIHISTQANNLNWRTCKMWFDLGAERVNLARELSLKEIAEIRKKLLEHMGTELDETIRLEAFVHGAMCMSFSGRCMLSDYMTSRSSNRGDCAQPCRWNYHIVEEQRPGQYMPVFENERGTFIFNSKDLCMLEYLPEMLEAGVDSLKIEGRMKSEYYTGVTVAAYRRAIDACCADPKNYRNNKALLNELMRELCMVSHRDYSTGFYLGARGEQVYTTSSYMRDGDFIGIVLSCDPLAEGGYLCKISQRGNFKQGDRVEFILPQASALAYTVEYMEDEKGQPIQTAPHAMMTVGIKLNFKVEPDTLVRRPKV